MSDNSSNSKRIAKNTLLLYIRMVFMMLVSLYTSRVILEALGVEDYGIYNVVGGISSLFCFITASMSQGIQRYITFELGKVNDGNPNIVFSIGIEIQIALSILIMLLVEIVGVWLIYNKLQIPENRLDAAFWVLQSTILLIPISLISSPYNALIIAHERMQAFAYISIFEVSAKLLVCYLLLACSGDRLILYGFLLVGTMFITQSLYYIYCRRNLECSKFHFIKDLSLAREIVSFSGWNMYGALAYVANTQGLNILLNMFFTPIVNAARGIAVQVQSAVNNFVVNFQMAINPQITKSYAAGDLSFMHKLIFRSAKFSFCLLLIISSPVIVEAETIMNIWLKTVPENTVIFIRLVILSSLITTIENPLSYAVQASGKVKKYQLIVSTLRLCILPAAYIVLKMGNPSYSVFITQIVIEAFVLFIRIILVKPLIDLSIKDFIKCVLLKTISVWIISYSVIYLICILTSTITNNCVINIFACLLITITIAYFIGLTKSERKYVNNIISQSIANVLKK